MYFALGKTYSSKVNNETISFVEAGPSQGDFCGSYNSPALDMQKPLGTQIISNNMIKSRGNTTCLNKAKQSSKVYFSLISSDLPFCYRWGASRGENSLCSKRQAKIIYCLTVLTTEQTNMGNAAAAELSGVNLYLREHVTLLQKDFRWMGKAQEPDLQHSPASSRRWVNTEAHC